MYKVNSCSVQTVKIQKSTHKHLTYKIKQKNRLQCVDGLFLIVSTTTGILIGLYNRHLKTKYCK
jgi:hypothetical protein